MVLAAVGGAGLRRRIHARIPEKAMIELASYTHQPSGVQWRLWMQSDGVVHLERYLKDLTVTIAGVSAYYYAYYWSSVNTVALCPEEIGIEMVGGGSLAKPADPRIALNKLSLLVERYLTEQRMKPGPAYEYRREYQGKFIPPGDPIVDRHELDQAYAKLVIKSHNAAEAYAKLVIKMKSERAHLAMGSIERDISADQRPAARSVPGGWVVKARRSVPDAVLRGLQLMRRHLDEGGHDWRDANARAEVAAARDWLDRIAAIEAT